MKKAIQHIARHHLRRFTNGLHQYPRSGSQEVMHALRVDMKAIRSICFLLEAAGKGRRPHQLHQRIRKLFAQAGRIREWQLEAHWLRQHHYVLLLRQQQYPQRIAEANEHFLRQVKKQSHFIQHWPKRFDQEIQALSAPGIRSYIDGNLTRILLSLYTRLPTTEWHWLRKECKRLLHAAQWLRRKRSTPRVVQYFIRDVDKLQSGIGHWHDIQVMQERFLVYRADCPARDARRTEWNLALKELKAAADLAQADVRNKLSVMHDRWIARLAS